MRKKTTTKKSVEKVRISGTWWIELDVDCLSELDQILTDIRGYGSADVLSVESIHMDKKVSDAK